MTKKLSRPQRAALRYAKNRQLYAADINEGNGNRRRTLLWLLKHGFLAWDPIYQGRVILTKLAEVVMRDRPGILRIRDVGDRRVITLMGVHKVEP